MKISEFQKLIDELYGKRDKKRGLDRTALWLIEEVGELAEAVRKRDKELAEEEVADVIAWTVSVANLMGIDVEKAVKKKYPGKCPRCNSIPCMCPKEPDSNLDFDHDPD